jgi:MFS transporter, SP family, general alpha glucoside:H+ symporter
MFNPDQENLGGKIGWIYLGTSVASLLIISAEFPETKDRTFVELDEMFK